MPIRSSSCYAEERGAKRRELPASWPGLRPEGFLPVRDGLFQAAAYPEAIAAAAGTYASRKSPP
jgi:hypothetical protein